MSTLRPHEELARVERLAGRPANAADLYHDLADDLPAGVPRAEMLLREFEARLQASQRREALAVLRQTGEMFGDHYRSPTLGDRVSEWKDRVIAATNRWSADLDQAVEHEVGGRGTLRLQMYRHILTKNDILDTRAGPRFRARFSAIAEKSRNALLLGYDRLFLAEACNIGGLYDRPDRAYEWFDEAVPMFERADHGLGIARVEFGRARLEVGEGHFDDALDRLDRAAEEFATSEPVDQRETYLVDLERARIALRRGELDRAVAIAERVRHLYRGNELAAFRANSVLLGTFLLRAELADAEVLLDDSVTFLRGDVPCSATAQLLHRRVKWNLRSGRPEVAEAELEVHGDRLRRYGLVQADIVQFHFLLARAQTHLALLTRKLHLNEPRRANHRKRARNDIDRIQRLESRLVPHLAAELDRTAAHLALLDDELEDARRRAEKSVERLADYADPLARTLGVEATGRVREALPSEEGDELLAHCREVYDHFDCRAPLLLEGWPPLASDSWLDNSDDEEG